jgi:hypothetical protein
MEMKLRVSLLAMAVLVVAGLSGGARADRLDLRLNDRMPDVVEQLKKKYKNVGVLRFRVQEGTNKPTFEAPLSGRLAERVETLLILNGGPVESEAMGVIHNAGAVALKQGVKAWYSNSADRRQLFKLEYPLAWGKAQVEPDVFLTGKVVVSTDRKKTTVTLESFDRDNPARLTTLGTYVINTDRFVLRDLGHSFVMSRGAKAQLRSVATRRATTMDDEDDLLVEEVKKQGKQPKQPDKDKPQTTQPDKDKPQTTQPGGGSQVKPDNVAGIKVELLVDDKPVSFREVGGEEKSAIKWQVDSPESGKPIVFRLTNTTDRRLAAVLKLNGVSTLNEQKDDPETSAKWILPAGAVYTIRGFYRFGEETQQPRGKKSSRRDGEEPAGQPGSQPGEGTKAKAKYLPFKVLVGEEANKAREEMNDKAGLIDLDVFEMGDKRTDDMQISPKGLPPSKEKQARLSYVGLRSALLKSSRLKTKVEVVKRDSVVIRRELIVPDTTPVDTGDLKVVDFPNPRLAGRVTIKVVPGEPLVDTD